MSHDLENKTDHLLQCCDHVDSYKIEDLILRWSSSRSGTNLLPTAFIPDFTIVDMSVEDCTSTYATGN